MKPTTSFVEIVAQRLLLLYLLFCFSTLANAQTALNIQYVQVSEKVSLAQYYLNQNNAVCAKKHAKEARELAASYRIQSFNEQLQNIELDLRFLLKDTVECIRIYRNMPVAEIRWQIPSLSQESNKFHFVYAADKHYYDSLYLNYAYDIDLQAKQKQLHDKLTRMMSEDQLVRSHRETPSIISDHILKGNSVAISGMDSIHIIQLKPLLQADSQYYLARSEMGYLFPISVHLTRYDTASFVWIKNYFDNCLGRYNRLSALLEENRHWHYAKTRTHTVYEYIPPQFTDDLPYESIDKLRLEHGLPSLFYEIINSNKKVPGYYKEKLQLLSDCTNR